MLYTLDNAIPNCDKASFIASNASVIGKVNVEEDVSVWFNAVIRGDNEPINIGKGSNIQDGSVLHTDMGAPLSIGEMVTVGHKVMLHGCTINNQCIIGMNSTILNYAVIGENSIVGANSLITENKIFPGNSLIMGSPATVVRELTEEELQTIMEFANHYIDNGKRYAKNLVTS